MNFRIIAVLTIILIFLSVSLKAQDIDKYVETGNKFFFEGKYPEAIKSYEKGLELAPDNGELWLQKGLAYRSLNKYDIAFSCYNKAIEINPKDFIICKDAWLYKGDALLAQEKYEEAIECYEKTLEIEPSNSLALKGRKTALDALNIKENKVINSIFSGSENSYFLFMLISIIFIYLYKSYCFMVIFQKNGFDRWPAFVPLLDWYYMYRVGSTNFWTNILFYSIVFILLHIPLQLASTVLNIFLVKYTVFITLPMPFVWMEVAYKCGRPSVWGYGMLFPILNLFVLAYIASGKGGFSEAYLITRDALGRLERKLSREQIKSLELVAYVRRQKEDLLKELGRLGFNDKEIRIIMEHTEGTIEKKSVLD